MEFSAEELKPLTEKPAHMIESELEEARGITVREIESEYFCHVSSIISVLIFLIISATQTAAGLLGMMSITWWIISTSNTGYCPNNWDI
jgi:hypothetical protein